MATTNPPKKQVKRLTKFSSVNMLVPTAEGLRKSPVIWTSHVGDRLTISDVVDAALLLAADNPKVMVAKLREVRRARGRRQ